MSDTDLPPVDPDDIRRPVDMPSDVEMTLAFLLKAISEDVNLSDENREALAALLRDLRFGHLASFLAQDMYLDLMAAQARQEEDDEDNPTPESEDN